MEFRRALQPRQRGGVALTNGVHLKSGKKLGAETGNSAAFTTYAQFEEAEQRSCVSSCTSSRCRRICLRNSTISICPIPWPRCSMSGCIEKGRDLTHGGAEFNTGPGMNGNGLADFVDSVTAVKKLVFEEGRVSMADLVAAVKADFEGCEHIRRMLVDVAPKWGNNNDEADANMTKLFDVVIKEIASYRGKLGNPKLPALYPVSSNVPQGLSVSALPSGRKAGKPLADGCSPSQGMDRLGPTAILQSLGKLPHDCIDGGTLLNIKLTPAVVAGEEGKRRLSAFLKTFLHLDVFHVQFNVVSHEVLRCAQRTPEDYKSLLVRVAGYSAYFVELSREIRGHPEPHGPRTLTSARPRPPQGARP
ncbi:MAG: pyruvate formate lyase family protein [Bilophila sp.]